MIHCLNVIGSLVESERFIMLLCILRFLMDMGEERRIMKDTMKAYKRKEKDREKGKRKNVIEDKTKVKKR